MMDANLDIPADFKMIHTLPKLMVEIAHWAGIGFR